MPTKTPKNKPSAKNDKPKQKITGAQIILGIFAILIIITMVLSMVNTNL